MRITNNKAAEVHRIKNKITQIQKQKTKNKYPGLRPSGRIYIERVACIHLTGTSKQPYSAVTMATYSAPFDVKCFATFGATEELRSHTITRRACSSDDVVIDIKYAGICHSDIHTARSEWGPTIYPLVPGHEIGGHVVAVGANVTKFKVGDIVGVGCMVDSCRSCKNCSAGDEQYCRNGAVFTYNSKFKYPHCVECNSEGGNPTYGGYSEAIVVDQRFVVSIPSNLDLAAATPLLCAGITVYSPMIHYGLSPNMRLAVAGLGGLGHMAVKIGLAFGCHVTVLSRGTSKKHDVLNNLKAHAFVDVTNEEEVRAAGGSFDFIVDTISAKHDVNMYVGLLAVDGKFIVVGASPEQLEFNPSAFIFGRKVLGGSLIGGVRETQEMLDFCGRHNITCDIERISAKDINVAYERTLKSDVKYRFVIDAKTLY